MEIQSLPEPIDTTYYNYKVFKSKASLKNKHSEKFPFNSLISLLLNFQRIGRLFHSSVKKISKKNTSFQDRYMS